jgi:hypothetical protein
MLKENGVHNNAVCVKREADAAILKNLVESPELLRFQLLASGFEDAFSAEDSLEQWGKHVGDLLSSAVTTFLYVPPSDQVSLAMEMLFGVSRIPRLNRGSGSGSGAVSAPFPRDEDLHTSMHGAWGPYRALGSLAGAAASSDNTRNDGGGGDSSASGSGSRYDIDHHPSELFQNFDSRWLLQHTKARDGHTGVSVKALQHTHASASAGGGSKRRLPLPFYRCDIVNMTRKVHHHYDYSRDGHARTYTMRILVNDTLTQLVSSQLGMHNSAGPDGDGAFTGMQTKQLRSGLLARTDAAPAAAAVAVVEPSPARSNTTTSTGAGAAGEQAPHSSSGGNVPGPLPVVSEAHQSWLALPKGAHPVQGKVLQVHLTRDKDSFPIPYTAIRGVTLISALRLGLVTSQRDTFFKRFLQLPLYEDMAPWNVVLSGSTLDYIDYDTMGVVFDADIPKAYRVMAVLVNYKRTVEDFRRCESSAKTDYGLHYVSDCVGTRAFSTYGGSTGNFLTDKTTVSCHSMETPVPCADGKCHTDYISCLRSLSDVAEEISKEAPILTAGGYARGANGGGDSKETSQSQSHSHQEPWSTSLVSAMRKGTAFSFD